MQLLNGVTLPPAAQEWVGRLGGGQRAIILGVGLGSVLLILGLAHWANRPTWVQLYGQLPMESVGEVTDRLDEAAIQYKLENGGTTLMVTSDDLARARVTLARDGGLPQAGAPGLELFDQPSWGMTDFTQRINYRRALEGELERTIGQMQGVESAQVHLGMDNSPGFRLADQQIEASVVLKLKNGSRPDPDVVDGIQHLVSSSVDGVQSERVNVLDSAGRLLSDPYMPGSLAAAASQELKTRREIEKYLEVKAEQIVGQIAGAGNVRVQVSADVSFDRVERTVETVDPDRQVLAAEQRAEIIPGAEGGAGSSNVSATYMNSRTVESFQGAVGSLKRLSVAVLLNETSAAGEGAAPTWTPEQLQRVQALVTSAVGLDPARGDVISVVNIPFESEPVGEEPVDILSMVETFQRPALTALALLFAFIVAMRMVRTLKAPEPAAAATQLAAATGPQEQPMALPADEQAAESELAKLQSAGDRAHQLLVARSSELRNHIAEQVKNDPEQAVKMLRTWLKEV